MVYFVEQSRRALEVIKRNLESLGITHGFQILQQEAKHAISHLNSQTVQPRFVFLDPPYRVQNAYRDTLELLAKSALANDALIIAEHEKRFDPGDRFGHLHRSRALQQGDSALSFYRRSLN